MKKKVLLKTSLLAQLLIKSDDCFEDFIKNSELYFLLPIAVEWITASYVMLCRIYVNVLYAIIPLILSHSLLTTYQQKY